MNDLKRPGTYLDLPAHIDRLDTSYTYTSRLYPILVNEDEVTSSLRVRDFKISPTRVDIEPDSLNVGAELASLEVRSIRHDYDLDDELDVSAELAGIELKSILQDYALGDELDVGASLAAIELKEILITNAMEPEGLDVTASLAEIKLEPQT